MMSDAMRVHRYATSTDVATAVAERVVALAREAMTERGMFHWALAGGTSPKQCYALLRDADVHWSRVHIWFGDERCLAVGDPERNDVMAMDALLAHVPIPHAHIHVIHAEQGAKQGAALYAEALSTIPALDLALLGVGEDGHTASLFPCNPALLDGRLAVPVYHAPKPPAERVSMGHVMLEKARHRLFMVTGEGKRDVFARVCAGEGLPMLMADSDYYTSL